MFREQAQPATGVKQFGVDTMGKKDHMMGTHASVRADYTDPPPKRTVPMATLEAARNVETHFIKARKEAEALRSRQDSSHLYAPGKGWGQ